MFLVEKEEHYSLFTKPKFHEARAGNGSENTGLYKKYVPTSITLDFLVEFFKFEERKRQGFSSPFLKKNPYENCFAAFVEEFEVDHKHLSPEASHTKLLFALELKHKKALASLK